MPWDSKALVTLGGALLLALFRPGDAWAACARRTTRGDLLEALDDARDAVRDANEAAFQGARNQAWNTLECLVEPIEPADAGRFHEMMAFNAMIENDPEEVLHSLRSAVAIDTWAMPQDLMPPDHFIWSTLRAAREAEPGGARGIAILKHGQILVDGANVEFAPVDRPCILQEVAFDGAVRRSFYMVTGAPLPGWAEPPVIPVSSAAPVQVASFVPPSAVQAVTEVEERDRGPGVRHIALLSATGVAAVVSGVSWAMADSRRDAFTSSSTPYEDLASLDSENARFTWIFVGTGAAAAGLGLTCILTW